MKNKILAIAALLLAVSARAGAYDDGDFQVWHTEVQEAKISKAAKLTLEEEARFGDDAGELFYHHYDAGIVYAINKHLDVGANYRQIFEKKGGKFKDENRPHVNATLKWEMLGFKLEDRNRMQYRHYNYQGDFWQYRNKFTMKFPWKFTRLEIQPFLSDEIFLNFSGVSFTRNRFYSGIAMNITKNVKAEVFYLLQSNGSSNKWTQSNVLGSKIKLAF